MGDEELKLMKTRKALLMREDDPLGIWCDVYCNERRQRYSVVRCLLAPQFEGDNFYMEDKDLKHVWLSGVWLKFPRSVKDLALGR